MFINAIVFPSPESSGFRRHKLNALFRISIFILIAVSIALFRTNAHAVQVKVTFDPSPDIRVIGHKIYYCQSANMSKTDYSEKIDLGTKIEYLTPNLKEETTYYFAATAYDKYGNESVFSEVISYKVPEKENGGGIEPDTLYLMEDFEKYSAGSNPADWFDTKAGNSMIEDTNLFKVHSVNNNKVLGTSSTLTNIHTHHLKSYINKLSSFEYSGRMMMTNSDSGIGVTFLSHYPFADNYYRLMRSKWTSNSFIISPHPFGEVKLFGITDSGVIPKANQWYKFRILVENTGSRTEILAKVWLENTSEPAKWQINAYENTSNRFTSGTFGVWSGGAGRKYWDDLCVKIPPKQNNFLAENFESYVAGKNPSDWMNTKANNSMVEDTNLFKVYSINNNKIFGTTSTLTNIHSHHLKSYIDKLSSAEYTGRMMMTDPAGGIGVTFLSHYPFTDTYYRLRCDKWNSFSLAPHPHATAKVFGITNTGVKAKANQWYQFRIKIQDTGARTEILAKVWPENTSEPAQWQIDAYDNTSIRVTSGTFGVWSGGAGNKYWDDLTVLVSN
jgi:hypothetical protein